MAQQIEETIMRSVFSPEEYSITSNNNNSKYIIKTLDEQKCLTLSLNPNNIYIDILEKCGKPGTDSLRKVDELAKKIPNVEYIGLEDQSELIKCDYTIKLATIKILTKGESWYNSLGYISDNYEIERAENKKIIEMKYADFIEKVYNIYFEQNKNKLITLRQELSEKEDQLKNAVNGEEMYKRILRSISLTKELISLYTGRIDINAMEEYKRKSQKIFPYTKNETVQEYFTDVWYDINNSKDCNEEKYSWLDSFLQKVINSNILHYDVNLKKIVNISTKNTEGKGGYKTKNKTKRKIPRKQKKSRSKK